MVCAQYLMGVFFLELLKRGEFFCSKGLKCFRKGLPVWLSFIIQQRFITNSIIEEGGMCGISDTASQKTELPTWSQNPRTGPVYPITGVRWEPRDSSYPVCSLGGVSTQEIRRSSRGTTGHGSCEWMEERRKSGRPQHGLMLAALVSGPAVEGVARPAGTQYTSEWEQNVSYSTGGCR